MTDLCVTRTGGFAGMRLSGAVPVEDAEQLGDRLAQLPEHRPAPDRYVYRLTLGEQSVTVGETDLPEDLMGLVNQALEG